MTEKKSLSKITFEMKKDSYEFAGDVPGPGSVGTEQIQDEAVMMDDLNPEVKDSMITDGDRVTAEELAGFQV